MKLLYYIAAVFGVQNLSPVQPDENWWKTSVFYQIYPRTFRDSDNDGDGDIRGVIEKLPHLKDAGIGATWLSPIFKSPMIDGGYDISDFKAIDPIFGTEEDFEDLIAEGNKLGVKIVLDFVPNHSSDQHQWFINSVNNVPGYEDYYIWSDCIVDEEGELIEPPNNWASIFGGRAWTYHPVRGQCYYHQFDPKQPDLNYRNPDVVNEIKDVLRYWLDRGAHGFRVDAIPHLVEDDQLRDEEIIDPNKPEGDYNNLVHTYTRGLDETYEMVYQWREVLEEYKAKDGFERVLMTEAYGDAASIVKFYGTAERPGVSFSFNFILMGSSGKDTGADWYKKLIDEWEESLPDEFVSNWVLGNHDNFRMATKYGKEKVDALNTMLMTLPGVAVTYNGEEIGMENGFVSYEDSKDPTAIKAGPEHYAENTRDFERTPFHWDRTTNAGFNRGAKPWLPVSELYFENNLEDQKRAEESNFKVYQGLTQLRTLPTMQRGSLETAALGYNDVLVLKRGLERFETFISLMNFGSEPRTVDLSEDTSLPDILYVRVASVGASNQKGSEVQTNSITVNAYEAIVLSTNAE